MPQGWARNSGEAAERPFFVCKNTALRGVFGGFFFADIVYYSGVVVYSGVHIYNGLVIDSGGIVYLGFAKNFSIAIDTRFVVYFCFTIDM